MERHLGHRVSSASLILGRLQTATGLSGMPRAWETYTLRMVKNCVISFNFTSSSIQGLFSMLSLLKPSQKRVLLAPFLDCCTCITHVRKCAQLKRKSNRKPKMISRPVVQGENGPTNEQEFIGIPYKKAPCC